MRCPYCNYSETKVIDTRESSDSDVTRRRRECLKCKKRFTTYERLESIQIRVIKKDGTREQFDRSKVMIGVMKACEKRPIDSEKIEKIVDEVESEILKVGKSEIPTKQIGEIVMKKLSKLDKIAYIRF